MLKNGDLVVCVNDKWFDVSGGNCSIDSLPHFPREGLIYTVSGGFVSNDETYLYLEEVDPDNSFDAQAFRPIQRTTSIEVFKKRLPLKEEAEERSREACRRYAKNH